MILAPETSSLTATDGASLSSRVRVSETLASRNSTVPPTAPTQSQQDTIDILDIDSFSSSSQLPSTTSTNKRARSPSETEEMPPPVTKPRLETVEQTPLIPVQTESMRFSSSATSVESQRSAKAEKENRRVPVVSSQEEEDEEDMFGFASIRSSRKRSQPLQDQSIKSQPRNKKLRPDDEDDIFVFNEIRKEISENSEPLEISFTTGNTESFVENSQIDKIKNIQQKEPLAGKISEVQFTSTGFLARDDVKPDVKAERSSDSGSGDVDDISDTVVKITLGSLVRPKKAKKVVSFTKYVPVKHDQTRVDNWLRENTSITIHEREQEEAERQSENLWNCDTIAIGKKN